MTLDIEKAKEMLTKLNNVSEEELTLKKIKMVLIRQYLEETKNQIKLREKMKLA